MLYKSLPINQITEKDSISSYLGFMDLCLTLLPVLTDMFPDSMMILPDIIVESKENPRENLQKNQL